MANEILVKSLASISVPITLTSVAASTGARQSDKVNLLTPRAPTMRVRLSTGFATAATAGGAVEVYVGFSSSSVAATANPALLTGADSAWTGYSSDAAQTKRQLTFVGTMSVSAYAGTVPQVCDVGTFTPLDQWACFVVVNTASQALSSVTTVHGLTVFPLADEVQ